MSSSHKREINILLLGETGVGKSTFINAFANYLNYDTIDEAVNGEAICLIPTQFPMYDENYQKRIVTYDRSDNECFQTGHSSTQSCMTYVFPFGKINIRLIDTPGVGDTRGIEQDKKNLQHMLNFIAEYDQLHLICILLKPDMPRLTPSFKYCLKHMLCHLQKDASKNMVFIFTFARQTFYRPKGTLQILELMVNEIRENPPNVEIPLNKKTMYCLDNDSFQFLIALKNNINFSEQERNDYSRSWKKSVKECQRLIDYVFTGDNGQPLEPHQTHKMLSINETRRLIITLGKPIADITQKLVIIMTDIEYITEDIRKSGDDIDALVMKIENNEYRFEFSFGYLVPIVGLVNAISEAMRKKKTEERLIKLLEDLKHSQNKIKSKEQWLQEMRLSHQELSAERSFIVRAQAKFAMFLRDNAIATYNDNYKQYVEEQIENMKMSKEKDQRKTIKNLNFALREYEEEIGILEKALREPNDNGECSLEAINKVILELYDLKNFGKEIKMLHEQSKIERSGKVRVEKEHVANPSVIKRFMQGINSVLSYLPSFK